MTLPTITDAALEEMEARANAALPQIMPQGQGPYVDIEAAKRAETTLALIAEVRRLKTPPHDHCHRRKAAIREAVTWLHRRADTMTDPHARVILNSAAFHLPELYDGRRTIAKVGEQRTEWTR